MSLKLLIKLITVLVIISLCIGAVSAAEDYTMWKGDIARSGYTEETGPLSNSVLWETEYLPEGTSGMYPAVDASPIAADGLVYYAVWGDGKNQVNGIYCADAYTGEERWRYNAATRGGFSLDNGVLYAGTLGGTLIALNALTGELIWTSDSLASFSYVGLSGAPLVVGDTVYITATTFSGSSYSSSIYAFNKNNGYKKGYSPVSLQSSNGDGGIGKFASLSSDGRMIYAAGSGGICAFDPGKKQIVWTFDAGARASQSIWVSTPVYSEGKLYLVKTPSSGNSVLYCVDASGKEIWKISDGNIGSSSPAVTDDKIVVTGKTGLTVYDKSGVMQFHYSTGDTGFASPVVAGSTAYFGTNADGILFAVDIVNQKLLWSYTLPRVISTYYAMIEATPAIYDGNLYVGSANCRMYAFGIAPEFSETKNTVKDNTWSAVTKAEVVYEFVPSALNWISAPEISHVGKTIRIGLDSSDSVKVQKKVGGVWSDVDASVNSNGKLVIAGDISNAERLRAAFTGRCLGDVNSNGKVDVDDASKILQYKVSKITFTDAHKYYADVNGNGKVDVDDASKILQYKVGKVNIYFK